MGVTINNKLTTTEPPPQIGQQPKPPGGGGGLNTFYWYQIFDLDSAVVEVQKLLSSHGSLLTIAMYHHRETLLLNQHTMMKQRKGLQTHI